MRFSPEGLPNCRADVAIWNAGVVDPDSQIGKRTGTAEMKALVSCEGCPLDGIEFPNGQISLVSELQMQGFLENNCPQFSQEFSGNKESTMSFDISRSDLPNQA